MRVYLFERSTICRKRDDYDARGICLGLNPWRKTAKMYEILQISSVFYLFASVQDVPPIPEEILSKKSFVAFPEAPKEGSVSKKAKRKQRRKKWLESNARYKHFDA